MIPIVVMGVCVAVILKISLGGRPSFKDVTSTTPIPVKVAGDFDLTPYLTEFSLVIRRGHYPSRWLVNQAINEAYHSGNWRLAKSISDNYTEDLPEIKKPSKKVQEKKEETREPEVEKEIEEKAPLFLVEKTTSPIDGVSNDDWRMFVQSSKIEDPSFSSSSSVGMFRQNKKRLAKLGISEEVLKDPVAQYDAFEKEILMLMSEGSDIFKQSVAMPIDVNGDNTPMTHSGLLAVMRSAGTSNASKWIDSADERKKFPHTTESFKRSNGCF